MPLRACARFGAMRGILQHGGCTPRPHFNARSYVHTLDNERSHCRACRSHSEHTIERVACESVAHLLARL